MSYEIKETSMVHHLEAVRHLNDLLQALVWIDTPTTRDFIARYYSHMHDYLSKEIGKNVLEQIQKADKERENDDQQS